MENSGKIMGLDFGERRLGVALSDSSQIIATGYQTIDCQKDLDFLNSLKKIAEEENVQSIVVGYPYRTDGQLGGKVEDVDQFIAELEKAIPLPIYRQDESYSSQKAAQILSSRGKKKKRIQDKAAIDRVAASIILQDYLDQREKS